MKVILHFEMTNCIVTKNQI